MKRALAAAGKPARVDLVVAFALAAIAVSAVLAGYHRVTPAVVSWQHSNIWFDSDAPLVYGNLTNTTTAWSGHTNTRRHPIIVLATAPLTRSLQLAFGASASQAVGMLLAGTAALCALLFYGLLRALALPWPDATIFTLLTAVSAAAIFWLPIPETYPFAAATILASLALVAASERGHAPPAWLAVAVAASTLAVTTTNWLAGCLMLVAIFPLRRALWLGAASFGLVLAGWWLQSWIAPSASFFVGVNDQDMRFFFHPGALGPLAIARAFFFHSMLVPALEASNGAGLSVQAAALGGDALFAGGIWMGLLAAGARGLALRIPSSPTVRVLTALLLANLLLHMVFGRETFLYSLHYLPLLVLATALAATGRARIPVLVLASVLTMLVAWNNLPRFQEACARLDARHAVLPPITAAPAARAMTTSLGSHR